MPSVSTVPLNAAREAADACRTPDPCDYGGNLWEHGEYVFLVDPHEPELKPLDAIVAFNDALQARGIELVVVPVPSRFRLATDDRYQSDSISLELEALGVKALDLVPIARKMEQPFLEADPHWSPDLAREAARLAAGRLEAMGNLKLAIQDVTYDHIQPVRQRLYKEAAPVTTLSVGTVKNADGRPLELNSPANVVVLGDSQTLWWAQAQGSFGHHVSASTGLPVHIIEVPGGGANNARIEFSEVYDTQRLLDGVDAVVWAFSHSAMHAEDWHVVPIGTRPPPTRMALGEYEPREQEFAIVVDDNLVADGLHHGLPPTGKPYRWARAQLAIPFQLPDTDYKEITIEWFPFKAEGQATQQVSASINGVPVGEVTLNPGWNETTFQLPASALRAGDNALEVSAAYELSPAEQDPALVDQRHMAFALAAIHLTR